MSPALRVFISKNVELVPIASAEGGDEEADRFGALEAVKLFVYRGVAVTSRLRGALVHKSDRGR